MARNTFKEDEVLETPFDFHHLLRASVYVKKYVKRMVLALIISALAAVTGLLNPIIVQRALDVAIPNKDTRQLVLLVLLLVVTYAISIAFSAVRSRIMTVVGQSIIFDIRKDLFAHLQKLPFQYYDDRPHGKFLSQPRPQNRTALPFRYLPKSPLKSQSRFSLDFSLPT